MTKRISELPAAAAISDTDELELNQAGTSRKVTRGQIVAGLVGSGHQHTVADIIDSGDLAALDTVGTAEIDAAAYASQPEAEAGADDAKLMTPLRTAEAIAAQPPAAHQHSLADIGDSGDLAALDAVGTAEIDAAAYASQPEAEAGADDAKLMTPLRTAEAIAAQPPAAHQHSLADISDAGTAASGDVGVTIGDVVQLENVGGIPGLPAVDGSRLTGISGAPAGYTPLTYTLVETTTEILDGGVNANPMGTRRHYNQPCVVTVIDTVPPNAQWFAKREGASLVFASVMEHAASQALSPGDRRWVDDGGINRVYVVTAGGTSGATAPSGTGTAIDTGDGVIWSYEQDGGPVTFNGEDSVEIFGGETGIAIFWRKGSTSDFDVGGDFRALAVLPPERAVAAVRNGPDLQCDLGQAGVFDYATDGTAFSAVSFLNMPASAGLNGALSVLLRLTRSGAGAVGFSGIDFGDDPVPDLGPTPGDRLYITAVYDGSTWAAVKSWSRTA